MSNIYNWYKFARLLYLRKIPIIPQVIKLAMRLLFSCSIPYTASIGRNTKFGYAGLGIVIHSRTIIGENCVISQNVTIGGTSKKHGVPVIGDNVMIGAGAIILGPIKIGNNVVVGANAVVVKDILDGTLVAGIPAKVIKNNISINNYI